MRLKIYQVDAFADSLFEGNPAAVCLLDNWLDDAIMQAIAAEMNVSETAFLVAKDGHYKIRWFTPANEVALCGHATLAAAHVLYRYHNASGSLRFTSQSGQLSATQQDGIICLDFPSQPPKPYPLTFEIAAALGGEPLNAFAAEDLIVCYSDASEIEILSPDIQALAQLPFRGVCVTAPGNGNGYDFVSRFFAPAVGVNEDPVTGSTHTELTPLYAEQTGRTQFIARQVSKRGGILQVKLEENRVFIAGKAVTALEGELHLTRDQY